jgi:hypothetical protein
MGAIAQRHNVEQHVATQNKLLNVYPIQPIHFPVSAIILHSGNSIIQPINNGYNIPPESGNPIRIDPIQLANPTINIKGDRMVE